MSTLWSPGRQAAAAHLSTLVFSAVKRKWGDGLVEFEFSTDTLSWTFQRLCELLGTAECAGDRCTLGS